jgi:hypothetical protein
MAAEREVWANTTPDGVPWLVGARPFSSFDEFCAISTGVVVWDELPLFVNSRKWQEFPDGLLYKLTQIRKDGLQLHFSTIDWRMVDVNVRRITFWTWECYAMPLGLFLRKLYPPEERRRPKERARRTELCRIRPTVCAAYDTFGKVAIAPRKTKAIEAASWGAPAGPPGSAADPDVGGRPPHLRSVDRPVVPRAKGSRT